MAPKNNKIFNPAFILGAIPATIIGVYTMNYFDVPTQFWAINLASVLVFTLVSLLFYKNIFRLTNINLDLLLGIAIILLLGTFWNKGISGVHRWMNLGSLQLNIGLLISPLLLFQISRENNLIYCGFIFVFVTIVFLLQPDASLVTAFPTAGAILMIDKLKNKIVIIILIILVLFSVAFSWYNLDKLQPVSHVEGIINLTNRISPYLYIISIFSLLLLILPFFISRFRKDKLAISLGVYYALLIASSFIGNFPLMIVGYGISPIIGYFGGLILLIDKTHKMSIKL